MINSAPKILIFVVIGFLQNTTEALKVCPTIHISGNWEELSQLKDCDVINGNLIVDGIRVSREYWNNYTSSLEEVTGYILLYDVSNLVSLDALLPKLRVIRGNHLVHGTYALSIFQIPDLQALNLFNLTTILNGGVFIQNCPQLNGYTKNIDWEKITGRNEQNSIEVLSERRQCHSSCDGNHCWSSNICQENCPQSCLNHGCSPSGDCCHPLCLGGCSEPNRFDRCYSCEGYHSRDGCRETCTDYYYEWDGFSCIWQSECKEKGRYLLTETNQCVEKCPRRYVANEHRVCIQNKTSVACEGGSIHSLEDSKRYYGCKTIRGSLFIRITQNSSTTFLKEALSAVSEISGLVYIFESTVESLSFLKSLSYIGGEELDQNMYSLIVRDCPNLHSLWTPSKQLILKKGVALLHHNPMLCPQTIQKLIKSPYLDESLESEETRNLINGYRTVCQIKTMEVKSRAPYVKGVVELEFSRPEDSVRRRLSGYMVYYRKAPDGIFYKGKEDIDSTWDVHFVEYWNEGGNIFHIFIHDLEPATRYAFFVSLSATQSSLTYYSREIIYQKTKPFNPSQPTELLQEYTEKHLALNWSPPRHAYGNIDYYLIRLSVGYVKTPHNSCVPKDLHKETQKSIELALPVSSNVGHQMNSFEQLSPPEVEDVLDTFSNIILHSNQRMKRALTREDSEMDYDLDLPSFPLIEGPIWQDNSKLEVILDGFIQDFSELDEDVFRSSLDDPKAAMEEVDQMLQVRSTLGKNLQGLEPVVHDETHGQYMEFEVAGTHLILPRETMERYPLQNAMYDIEIRACNKIVDECPQDKDSPCSLCSQNPLKDTICVLSGDLDMRVVDVGVTHINDTFISVSWKPPKNAVDLVSSYMVFLGQSGSTIEQVTPICVHSTKTSTISHLLHPGEYKVVITTELLCRNATTVKRETTPVYFVMSVEQYWPSLVVHIGLSVLFLIGIIVLYCIVIVWVPNKRYGLHKVLGLYSCTHKNYEFLHFNKQLEQLIPKEWRHPSRNLIVGEKIGEGNFGQVFKGSLSIGKEKFAVAAKVLKQAEHLDKDFINEATLMMKARSHHLVRTYGISFKNAQMFLLMEFMENGTLESFLKRRHRGEFLNTPQGSSEQLLHFALQVADGMLYLESQKIIHRDLAARNCLLDVSYNAKISDFGLSRFTKTGGYAMTGTYAVPLRRMPPEYFHDEPFTTKSDVWLYGIFLWEIVTECSCSLYEQFADLDINRAICEGFTLEASLPPSTPVHFSTVMAQSWRRDPRQRKSFQEIISYLLFYARDRQFILDFWTCSFYFNCNELPNGEIQSTSDPNGVYGHQYNEISL